MGPDQPTPHSYQARHRQLCILLYLVWKGRECELIHLYHHILPMRNQAVLHGAVLKLIVVFEFCDFSLWPFIELLSPTTQHIASDVSGGSMNATHQAQVSKLTSCN